MTPAEQVTACRTTTRSVELDGWYEHTDGTFGFYVGAARPGGSALIQFAASAAECVKRDETGAIYEVGWPARAVIVGGS